MIYSRAAMVKGAQAAGFSDASERMLTDWVALGLLDHPQRSSRGKGGGSGAFYAWPAAQFELFLALLSKRAQVSRVAGLCVIPVAVWMYWGDNLVPLGQVRVALQTWWDAAREVGKQGRAERAARTIVDTFVPDRRRLKVKTTLRSVLADSIVKGEFDVPRVESLISELLEATQGGTWGPFAHTPGEVVRGMRAMTVAMRRYDDIPDDCFLDVRERQRFAIRMYVRDYPSLVNHPTFGEWFEDPNVGFLFNQSCHHLLLGLGLWLLVKEEGIKLQPVPDMAWTGP